MSNGLRDLQIGLMGWSIAMDDNAATRAIKARMLCRFLDAGSLAPTADERAAFAAAHPGAQMTETGEIMRDLS